MLNLLIPAVTSLLDKVIPDPSAKAEAQLKLLELSQAGGLKELEASMNVVVAEAQSEHWLTSTWRPITMLTFVTIIAFNYILFPVIGLFIDNLPPLEIPPDMWDLLKIGLGGYVVSRGVEKSIKEYKK